MASILDENPGFVGSFCDGKLTEEEKSRRDRRREKLEKAMEKRGEWSEFDFEAERLRLEQEVQAMLAAREEAKRDAA